MTVLTAFTPITVAPECRINMSAFSDRILLVDVSKVSMTDETISDGLGHREINVEGTIIEVIRGEQSNEKFHGSKSLLRVVDAKAVEASRGVGSLEVFYAVQDDQSGISECKEDKRYVVCYPGSDSRFQDVFYAEVAKDNDDWRKKILPRKDPDAEKPPRMK